jgi:hypothetical protein
MIAQQFVTIITAIRRSSHYNAIVAYGSRVFSSDRTSTRTPRSIAGGFASQGECDMTSRWWRPSPFDRMHELAFKRVPEGWIFRAPNPWIFGPGRHYLIDEAQKSELSPHLRQIYRVGQRTIIILVAIAVPLALVLNDKYPVMTFTGLVVGAAATAFVVMHLAVAHGPAAHGWPPANHTTKHARLP